MLAKLENDTYNLYEDNNVLIGKIKTKSKSNFKESEIIIGEKNYKIVREKRLFQILEDDKIVYNLKTNYFFGSIELLETKQKIKGVLSSKWGTKLVDKENNTLLKIRNENQFINNEKYVIEISNNKVKDFDVLLTLFGHLYGSSMKQKAVIFSTIAAVIVASRILAQ